MRASGLSESEVAAWVAATPQGSPGSFEADADATTSFLEHGERLIASLPERPQRDESELAAAATIVAALHDARDVEPLREGDVDPQRRARPPALEPRQEPRTVVAPSGR